MNLPVPWLPLAADPNFLFQFQGSSTGYAIRITDLTHLWTEDCHDDLFVKRANDAKSPVDAGVDGRILVDRIRGIPSSSSTLIARPETMKDDQLQEVDINALEISGPVPGLDITWSFTLTPSSISSLTTSLFQISIYYHHLTKSLIDEIREKERCLVRVMEYCQRVNVEYTPRRRYRGFQTFEVVRPSIGSITNELTDLGDDEDWNLDWKAAVGKSSGIGSRPSSGGLITTIGGKSNKSGIDGTGKMDEMEKRITRDQRTDSIDHDLDDTTSDDDSPSEKRIEVKSPETPKKKGGLISVISPRKARLAENKDSLVRALVKSRLGRNGRGSDDEEDEEDENEKEEDEDGEYKKRMAKRAELENIVNSKPVKRRKF